MARCLKVSMSDQENNLKDGRNVRARPAFGYIKTEDWPEVKARPGG